MTRLHLGLLVVASVSLVSAAATADVTIAEDGTQTLSTITVYGRPQKPSVVIELTRPTAARAATVAHDEMRVKLLEKTAPKPLR